MLFKVLSTGNISGTIWCIMTFCYVANNQSPQKVSSLLEIIHTMTNFVILKPPEFLKISL